MPSPLVVRPFPCGAQSQSALSLDSPYLYGIEFIEKVLKIDDPVGAIAVHGFCPVRLVHYALAYLCSKQRLRLDFPVWLTAADFAQLGDTGGWRCRCYGLDVRNSIHSVWSDQEATIGLRVYRRRRNQRSGPWRTCFRSLCRLCDQNVI